MPLSPNTAAVLFTEISGQGGNLGSITLNRPQVMNVLDEEMCVLITAQLNEWKANSNIKGVIIRGAGYRAFCAGGDLKPLYALRNAGMISIPEKNFFCAEYQMNKCVFHFGKPYIALLDGITMGGGVGVSVHGSHRVVTERFVFAMPETAIGFFPDVGGSYFLPRCRGKAGFYLGLTGARINAADAIYVGVADQQLNSMDLTALVDSLANTHWRGNVHSAVTQLIQKFAVTSKPALLAPQQTLIDTCFSQPSIEAILMALEQSGDKNITQLLQDKSPTSLKVTLQQLQRGSNLDFDHCMQMEYGMAKKFALGHDFL